MAKAILSFSVSAEIHNEIAKFREERGLGSTSAALETMIREYRGLPLAEVRVKVSKPRVFKVLVRDKLAHYFLRLAEKAGHDPSQVIRALFQGDARLDSRYLVASTGRLPTMSREDVARVLALYCEETREQLGM